MYKNIFPFYKRKIKLIELCYVVDFVLRASSVVSSVQYNTYTSLSILLSVLCICICVCIGLCSVLVFVSVSHQFHSSHYQWIKASVFSTKKIFQSLIQFFEVYKFPKNFLVDIFNKTIKDKVKMRI